MWKFQRSNKVDILAACVAIFGPWLVIGSFLAIFRVASDDLVAAAIGILVGTGVAGVLGLRCMPVIVRAPLAALYGVWLFIVWPIPTYFIGGFVSNFT
jgi:hypothetical protein